MGTQLFEVLLKAKLITPGQVRQCEEYLSNATSPAKPVDAILGLGLIADKAIAKALSKSLNVPYVKIQGERIPTEVVGVMTPSLASQHRIMPLKIAVNKKGQQVLFLAMGDITDEDLKTHVAATTGLKIKPVATPLSHIMWAIEAHYGQTPVAAATPTAQPVAAPIPQAPVPTAAPTPEPMAPPPDVKSTPEAPPVEGFEAKKSLFESLTLEEEDDEEEEAPKEEEKKKEEVPQKRKRLTLADRRREIREREKEKEKEKELGKEENVKPAAKAAPKPAAPEPVATPPKPEVTEEPPKIEELFQDLPSEEIILGEEKTPPPPEQTPPELEVTQIPPRPETEAPAAAQTPPETDPRIAAEDMPTIVDKKDMEDEDTVSGARPIPGSIPEPRPEPQQTSSIDITEAVRRENEPLLRELSRISQKLDAITRLLIKKRLINPRDIDEELK